ncbi:hypothetical protein B0H17DRAFT_1136339 [Mycena rosella]|uniref:Uncharacterized protein n=1 Tax=Mycena rosella TaxID=1033263 RepID=A0AAD7GEN8_MYCRO|nr:hypothetical protein B0H17DRAFT_1136339 [Mycena rosella]
MDDQELVPLPLETIHIVFSQLGDRVNAALCTQIRDKLRLQEQHGGVLWLQEAIQQHIHIISPAEQQIMEDSLLRMLKLLSSAVIQSQDLPATTSVTVPTTKHTGRRGRPHIRIDQVFLEHALQLQGPSGIATVVGLSTRTIRQRALDYGLAEPAAPVYTDNIDEVSGTAATPHTMQLCPFPLLTSLMWSWMFLMHHILEIFPMFGRRMIVVAQHGTPRRVREIMVLRTSRWLSGWRNCSAWSMERTYGADARGWAQTWNAHKICIDHERTRSPEDHFFFGIIQNGLRGYENPEEEEEAIENLEAYSMIGRSYCSDKWSRLERSAVSQSVSSSTAWRRGEGLKVIDVAQCLQASSRRDSLMRKG